MNSTHTEKTRDRHADWQALCAAAKGDWSLIPWVQVARVAQRLSGLTWNSAQITDYQSKGSVRKSKHQERYNAILAEAFAEWERGADS